MVDRRGMLKSLGTAFACLVPVASASFDSDGKGSADTSQRFYIRVSDAILSDLKSRLLRTRWPDEIPESGWDYGSNLSYLRELCDYWATRFDWRAQEKLLNSHQHYVATVEGIGIHFVHERSREPRALPLLLTHGWPSTFVELRKLIPRLVDPVRHGGRAEDAFDVVVPSVPGYGFSERPSTRGTNSSKVADLWAKLMTQVLGYERFGAHGGDIGAGITSRLGFAYPDQLIGIHLTAVRDPYRGASTRELSDAERRFLAARDEWSEKEGGYSHVQRTKPQTLTFGLNDSPAGLAAWMVEKYRSWSDCAGNVERRFTKDEMLTHCTIYWATETIGSSVRYYFESTRNPWNVVADDRVNVPTGVAVFPYELSRPPREWAERFYNVKRYTEMPRGGHFAAHEEPDLLADDLRAFFSPLRKKSRT